MIVFKNAHNKEEFSKLVLNGDYSCSKVSQNEWLLCNDQLNHLEWTLKMNEDGYELISNDEYCHFTVYLNTDGVNVEIKRAIDKGKNIKSDRLLSKFKFVSFLAACFVNGGYIQ